MGKVEMKEMVVQLTEELVHDDELDEEVKQLASAVQVPACSVPTRAGLVAQCGLCAGAAGHARLGGGGRARGWNRAPERERPSPAAASSGRMQRALL